MAAAATAGLAGRTARQRHVGVVAPARRWLSGEAKPLLPAVLEPLGVGEAYVTIVEGRYHQVRRMFAAVGNRVVALHRDQMGDLALPEDLEVGQYRVVVRDEVVRVFG